MKALYKILGLVIIDFCVIWVWVYNMDPDPSVSIGIILLVPFVIILNLIIGGALFFLKRKEYSRLFLINSILSAIIMYYLFGKGIDRHQNNRLESWEFQKKDTTYSLIRWKKTGSFSISYSLNPGSSWSFLDGNCELINNEWILTSDSLKMKIIENKLIGFGSHNDTINMKKRER